MNQFGRNPNLVKGCPLCYSLGLVKHREELNIAGNGGCDDFLEPEVRSSGDEWRGKEHVRTSPSLGMVTAAGHVVQC